MGFLEGGRRVRNTGIWALVLVVGLILIPGTLASIWFKFESIANARVQFNPGHLQVLAATVATLVVGGWIVQGLLKEE